MLRGGQLFPLLMCSTSVDSDSRGKHPRKSRPRKCQVAREAVLEQPQTCTMPSRGADRLWARCPLGTRLASAQGTLAAQVCSAVVGSDHPHPEGLGYSTVITHEQMLNFSLCFHAANRWALLAVTAGLRAVQEQECKSIKCLYSSFTSSSSHMLFTRIAVRLLWGAARCKARFLICWEELWGCTGCSGPGEDGLQLHVNQP